MKEKKKELKKQYAQTMQPMGIYQVRNLTNGKILIARGLNVHGIINSCKFQLANGSHMNKELQHDFNKLGPHNFAFEIIDRLDPQADTPMDYSDDLKLLEEMWIEKLQPFDEKGYNKRKIIR